MTTDPAGAERERDAPPRVEMGRRPWYDAGRCGARSRRHAPPASAAGRRSHVTHGCGQMPVAPPAAAVPDDVRRPPTVSNTRAGSPGTCSSCAFDLSRPSSNSLIRLVDVPARIPLKLAPQGFARTVVMEYGRPGRREFPLDGLAADADFLALLREATVHTLHTQEARPSRKSSCASPAKACSEPMHRLAATVLLDLRLQLRNGFYYAVAFVLACWFLLLTRLPPLDWGYVLPAVIFGNLVMVNFYFVAGLVLLEKDEGTLEAQVVTPLADWEYLASKTATLAARSVVEQVAIVWSAYGGGFAAGPLVGGIVLAADPVYADRLSPRRPLPVDQRVQVPLGPFHRGSLAPDASLLRPLGHLAALSPSLHGTPRAAGRGVRADSVVAVGLRRALCLRLGRAAAARRPAGVRPLHRRPRGEPLMPTDAAVIRALGPIDVKSVARDRACCGGWSACRSSSLSCSGGASRSSMDGSASATGSTSPRFLLLDHRDDRTLTALQVTPLTVEGYLAYRIAVPMVVSVPVMMASVAIADLVTMGVVPAFRRRRPGGSRRAALRAVRRRVRGEQGAGVRPAEGRGRAHVAAGHRLVRCLRRGRWRSASTRSTGRSSCSGCSKPASPAWPSTSWPAWRIRGC